MPRSRYSLFYDCEQFFTHNLRAFLLVWCVLGILLSNGPLNAKSFNDNDPVSIKNVLRSGRPDTNQVKTLLKLGEYYLQATLNPRLYLDSALMVSEDARQLSFRLAFARGREDAIMLRGKVYVRQHKTDIVLRMMKMVSDTSRIKLLLELGKNKLRSTYTQQANRDSAVLFFRQAETISEEIGNQKWLEESRSLIGVTYLLDQDWAKGKAYFMKVIEARKQRDDKAGEISAILRMVTTTFCDDCRENIRFLKRALDLSRQLGDQSQEMLILMEMGYEYFQLNGEDIREVENKANEVLAIQKKIGSGPLNKAYHTLAQQSVYKMPGEYGYLSNAYYFMSDVSQAKGDLNQKLFYILRVVENVESNGQVDELDYAYYKLGNAYYELGQFDKSMEYHRKSQNLSAKKGQLFIQVGLASRMVVTMLNQGKAKEALRFLNEISVKNLPYTYEDKMLIAQSYGACYNALNQQKLAEKYFLENVMWSKKATMYFQYMAWRRISQFYVTTGQYNKADHYLKQLLAAPSTKIIPSHRIEIHLMRFKVDSARANYPAAIRHYQQYKTLNDSIFNERKSKQITQLSIQYETGKKDQDLKMKQQAIQLLTEQSQLQKNQLEQAATIRNGVIAGATLLILLLGLGLSSYRLKQRSNRLLEAQQIEINRKNHSLELIVMEKDHLLVDKEELLIEKDHLLEEREWMLMEMHHRVKNNLQIISSLLRSQGSFLKDKEALAAIQESHNRVHAMALIHQKLYQTKRLASIPMVSYIEEIVDYLINSFNPAGTIRKNISIAPVDLDVSVAVPIGLILNEVVTNSLKYAFPDGRVGTLTIELNEGESNTYRLVIGDDGIGFPADLDLFESDTLGMSLIRGLSKQIDGSLNINQSCGVQINLTFTEERSANSLAGSLRNA